MFAGKRKILAALAAVVAVAAIGGGAAIATGVTDDNSQPITGEALQKASKAALDYTGGGRVTETEVGDEDSYYEVEVTKDDGSQVDVQLDENFNVVDSMSDNEKDDGQNDGSD
jgi:uncharacterized membrane protein YkoI